ncbi:hypothetical protein CAter282_3928 [Collimonas arenae]|uniref:Uncharacterized protein n=1 Tax=Collimonas arenae TaxID=279058 RepID=A0A127QNI3_9BURK|nr:hypothetical protein CAter10_4283 [Collimonas arenae]AMP11599.1 hypothetical protein CAter282_3928 [Collimonas arenae]
MARCSKPAGGKFCFNLLLENGADSGFGAAFARIWMADVFNP